MNGSGGAAGAGGGDGGCVFTTSGAGGETGVRGAKRSGTPSAFFERPSFCRSSSTPCSARPPGAVAGAARATTVGGCFSRPITTDTTSVMAATARTARGEILLLRKAIMVTSVATVLRI